MKISHTILGMLLALLMTTACQKDNPMKGVPGCIQEKINAFKTSSICNDAAVVEYKFQDKAAYVFSQGNCGADLGAEVLDASCQKLGMLGGIAGNQQINNEDFKNATLVRVIWWK